MRKTLAGPFTGPQPPSARHRALKFARHTRAGVHHERDYTSPRNRKSLSLATRRPAHPHGRHHGLPLQQRRTFITSALNTLPPWLVPPAVFAGLLVTLWIYKCVVTVVFQEKIIYMPYMPPFTRSEKVEDYAAACRPVVWREGEVTAADGVRVVVCVGNMAGKGDRDEGVRFEGEGADGGAAGRKRHVIICYFHGNGGSVPPRLPMLSNVLKSIHAQQRTMAPDSNVDYTVAALSYRGYWTSSGRPSQRGIELDAQALLKWVNEDYAARSGSGTETQLILWGQSIGAGVASTAAASYARSAAGETQPQLPVMGLVLETPFTSIKSMLLALYPQKWLPYRYLGSFLRSHWDTEAALRALARTDERHKVLLVPASRDEIVPAGEAEKLEAICRGVGLEVERKDVQGALHTEATIRREGREAVAVFVVGVANDGKG